jgi:hypothetical protein
MRDLDLSERREMVSDIRLYLMKVADEASLVNMESRCSNLWINSELSYIVTICASSPVGRGSYLELPP